MKEKIYIIAKLIKKQAVLLFLLSAILILFFVNVNKSKVYASEIIANVKCDICVVNGETCELIESDTQAISNLESAVIDFSDVNVELDENEKLDYIKTIVCDGKTSTAISNIYYINIANVSKNDNVSVMDRQYSLNNYDNKYKKTENTSVEYYFENQDILNQLKGSGYRYLITTDANLSPISNIEDVNRLHIIAIKREQ